MSGPLRWCTVVSRSGVKSVSMAMANGGWQAGQGGVFIHVL